MTRNAPTVTDDPTYVAASFRFIDRTGDKRSDTIRCDPAVTDAQLEAAAAKYSAASQALLYEVQVTRVWAGVPVSSSAAAAGARDSVYDQLVLLMKTPDGQRQEPHIFAPYEGLLAADSDNPDVADTRYTEWRDAVEACMVNAFEPVTVRFTERSEINKAVPAG